MTFNHEMEVQILFGWLDKYRGVEDMSRFGNVPTREEAKPPPVQPSVTLKVGLEEYKEKLNQLEKLVEELNGMEISVEVTKE